MLEDKRRFGEQIAWIEDCTPSLSFIYGNGGTDYLRIEVDNRLISNDLAISLLNKVLSKVLNTGKNKNRDYVTRDRI